ncbi:MAG: hypothetical protein IJ443_03200, partial [Firmicutes bacterium]|nr:hypothetical protein [Bacillota bacterium]
VIWDDLFLVLVCLIVCGKLIFRIRMVMKNKKSRSIKDIVRIAFLSVILLLGILTLVFGWVDWKVKKFNPYEKAYTEGNLEVVTGKAENVEWYRGGFSFTVDDVNFGSDIGRTINREMYIEPYFNNGYELKIYYYGEDKMYYATVEDEGSYRVFFEALRIDVLIDDTVKE